MRIFKLIWKNLLRHKLRSLLTTLGIAIAVIAFGLLRTVVSAWSSGVEASAVNRLITRHAVSFIFPLPYAYKDQIARIPGVASVTFANWFQGVYIDRTQFFPRLAVDAETYLENYPEFVVDPQQMETFKRERNACIVGEKIARTYGLKLGDVMQVEGDIYPGRYEFVVRGIYRPRDKKTDATQMFFHWTYIDERLKQESPVRAGQVGWYVITLSDQRKAAQVIEAVDVLFRNSRAETKTETEAAFQQSFVSMSGAIISAMNLISFVIIGIILLVLANTMVMTARERIREYAVFKTLGFKGWHIVGLILGESLFISLGGGTVGLLLTFPITKSFEAALPTGWFPIFRVEPETIVLSLAAALLVGVVASLFPIWRATSIRIVDGLGHIG